MEFELETRSGRRSVLVNLFSFALGGSRSIGVLVLDVTQERELERRRDAFISVASHELRTPLTSLLGFSELLLSRDPPEEIRREWLDLIHQETLRLTHIVDDMLNVSRVQSARLTLNVEWVDIREVAREVVTPFSGTSHRHRLVVEISESVPKVSADREKLKQVLINLVDNAIKYSPDGGIVTVAARHEPERQRVVVSISDEGLGIAAEDREKLFNTFSRIRRPETQQVRGTGLGLYIVKSFVEMMRGEVWVESKVGKGSTFSFTVRCEDISQFVGGG